MTPISQGREAFHVHLERGVFHCFACGAGGNVLDLVAAMEGCSIREAALRLQGSPAAAGMAAGTYGLDGSVYDGSTDQAWCSYLATSIVIG